MKLSLKCPVNGSIYQIELPKPKLILCGDHGSTEVFDVSCPCGTIHEVAIKVAR
jgi:hypothetical protein